MSLKRFSGCLTRFFLRRSGQQVADRNRFVAFCRVVFWAVVVLVQSAQGAP